MADQLTKTTQGETESTTTEHALSWHASPEEAVYKHLRTAPEGLSTEEAGGRLREYGPNLLPGKKPPTLVEIVLHQFKSPLIYILLIAGIVSVIVGDVNDALFIFAVLVLNAAIGAVQEWRAEQSAHALQTLLKIHARVRRGGETVTVSAEELVPGDVVLLESGDKVPADLRLITLKNLTIDEAFLTGESLPAQKVKGLLAEDVPVSDRKNMAFAGATVVTGRGMGLVVGTGLKTEVGQIARSLTEVESAKPPLVIRMERFATQIGLGVLVFAAVLGSVLVMRQMPVYEVFFVMVAMVVSAIPEGLPVAMTVALSLATSRMTKRKVIARRLVAVESLGSCTTIASDKTGTLTVNQQTVKVIVLPDGARAAIGGQGYNDDGEVAIEGATSNGDSLRRRLEEIGRSGIFCNEGSLIKRPDGWHTSGDSMDIALLSLGHKLGLEPDQSRRQGSVLGEIPFESEKRYAATAYRLGRESRLVVKGAVEAVTPFCAWMRTGAGDAELDASLLQRQAEELAEGGYRVLALATRGYSEGESSDGISETHLRNLVMLGLVGFMDPLRPEVKEAVDRAHGAGVKVVMITGDHPATALAIARQLDIARSGVEVLTGAEMAEGVVHDTPEFHARLRRARVFARVTPQQKLDIVEHLMRLGDFVAVTGDGVNDAPALNRANIGVAMGSGTEVAKDAAEIIVTDDNFASIVNGIEEGRYAYANVRKVTLFLISTGFAELVLIGTSVAMGMPIPLLAAQILWLNLVTNGIQDVALAFEAGEKGVMNFPPRRPTEGIFNRKMIEQVLVGGLVMAAICIAAWLYIVENGADETALAEGRNIILALMIMLQFYHVLNCRSEYRSAFRIPLRNNRILAIGMVVAFSVHLAATHIPLTQTLLRVTPLPLEKWLLLGALAAILMAVMEGYKWLRRGDVPTGVAH